jgi:hypothetical protein
MKPFHLLVFTMLLVGCEATSTLTKSVAYAGVYEEQPGVILVMPPINRSTDVEAKEFFHSTLTVPLADRGYYVVPPFLSMDVLKRESAYDSELFLNQNLSLVGGVFGADAVLFTIIHRWDKSLNVVNVDVEYVLKSTKTNRVLFTRRGEIAYDTTVKSNIGGLAGIVADLALTAANTAMTPYVEVARKCNVYTLKDFPIGKYGPMPFQDGAEMAGRPVFKVALSSESTF